MSNGLHHGLHIGIFDHWHKRHAGHKMSNGVHHGLHIGIFDHWHKRHAEHKNIKNPYGNFYKRRQSISCPSSPTGIKFEPTGLLLEKVAEILHESGENEGSSSPAEIPFKESTSEISGADSGKIKNNS